jgi:hypothetical protein
MQPRGLGQRRRLVAEVRQVELAREQVADLRPILVDRRHQDVRLPVVAQLDDQLGQVRLHRPDARVGERLVELYLVRRDRLHLHDLGNPVRPSDRSHDRAGLIAVVGPVHHTARSRHRGFERSQMLGESTQGGVLRSPAGGLQLGPVGQLAYHASPLLADRACRLAQVATQLGITKGP